MVEITDINAVPQPEPIVVGGNPSSTPIVPKDIADQRAYKASFGIPQWDKTTNEVSEMMQQGQEDSARVEATQHITFQKEEMKRAVLEDFAKSRPDGKIRPEEMYLFLKGLSKHETFLDPQTVFEEYFSKSVFNELDKAWQNSPDSVMAKANREMPDLVNKLKGEGSSVVTVNQILLKNLQDAQSTYDEQSWGGWGVDQAKALFPGYTDTQMRGNVPGVGFFDGGLLGNNLQEQAQAILHLPTDQMIPQLKTIQDYFKEHNPSLGLAWAKAIHGQSTGEQFLNNAITLIDLSQIKPLAAAKLGATAIGKVELYNQAANAVKGVARAVIDNPTNISSAKIQEAIGNLSEAAVRNVVDRTTPQTVVKPATVDEALPSILKGQKQLEDSLGYGPHLPSYARELTNRLIAKYEDLKTALVGVASDVNKVDRLPGVFAREENVRAIQAEIKDSFPGLDNSILNISDPYIRDPVSNTWAVNLELGKTDGTLFSTETQARTFMQQNGMQGNVVPSQGATKFATNIKDPSIGYVRLFAVPGDNLAEGQVRLSPRMPDASRPIHYIDVKKGSDLEKSMRLPDGNYLNSTVADGLSSKLKLYTAGEGPIVQKGNGFIISLPAHNISEIGVVRDALVQVAADRTPDSLISAFGGFFGKLRTPEDTLSLWNRINRKTATYAPSVLFKEVKEMAEDINKLKSWSSIPFTNKKKKWDEFNRAIKAYEGKDDITGEQKSFAHPQEMSSFWQTTLGRLPDEQEINAYFAYKRLNESNEFFRNITDYRNKARVGAKTYTAYFPDETTLMKGGKTFPTKGATFDGVRLKELPKGDDTALVMSMTDGVDHQLVSTKHFSQTTLGKSLETEIARGTSIALRLINPEDRPLNGFGKIADERIRYIVIPNGMYDEKQLTWNQRKFPRVAEYDYEHYVGQADVRFDKVSGHHWYEGDRYISAHNLGAQAKAIAQGLDTVRQLIKANKLEEAAAANPLPHDFNEVMTWFKGGTSPDGKAISARLNLDEKIQAIPRNKMIVDTDVDLARKYEAAGQSFRDATKEGYGRFFEKKPDPHQVFTLENKGTKANPLYNAMPAKFIDPLTSVNRALSKTINDQFLNDYKIYSVEHWVQEAKKFMNVSEHELNEAPYYYFYHPSWRSTDDFGTLNKLKTANFQIQQFLGVTDDMNNFVHWTTQKLADSIYDKGYERTALIASHLLPYTRDPFGFIRSVAFHAKLGLFALPQLFVQAQTFSVIYGIAGAKFAAPGTKAAMLHGWSRINRNPEIMDSLDAIASKQFIPGTAQWKPGEFKEASDLIARTGFGNVAGEHALKDNPAAYDIISNPLGKLLNWGAYPFTAGERNTRYGAFFTAYLEHRAENPTGRVTDEGLKMILNRADTLTVNMSRASSSIVHQGALSTVTQFMTYQLRMAELMFGKGRLTPTERTRLIATNMALYGIPATAGVSGLPLGDWMRRQAQENGYVVGENGLTTALMEGIPAYLIGKTTGAQLNIGERYGNPSGLNIIKDALSSDTPLLDTLGGASVSTAKGILATLSPFTRKMASVIANDNAEYPLVAEDLLEPIKQLSSGNALVRAYQAMNTGIWINKNEAHVSETSPLQAFFMTVFGLQPQAASDAYSKITSIEFRKERYAEALKEFIKEWRRGMRASADGVSDGEQYFKRARAILIINGYPIQDYGKAMAIATDGSQTLIDKIDQQYYLKGVPQDKAAEAQDTFARIQQMKGNQ